MASPVDEIKVRCENRHSPEEQEGMLWPVLIQARAIGRSEGVHRVRFPRLEFPVSALTLWVLVVSIAGQADFAGKFQVGDALGLRFLHHSGEMCTVSCWTFGSQGLSATCYKHSPEHLLNVLCNMHGNISLLIAFAFFSYLVPHQSPEHLFLKGLICMGIQDGGLLHHMLTCD